jgi:hypothetical protein
MFAGSNGAPPWLTATMWSTVSAAVITPSSRHMRQSGSRRSWALRTLTPRLVLKGCLWDTGVVVVERQIVFGQSSELVHNREVPVSCVIQELDQALAANHPGPRRVAVG